MVVRIELKPQEWLWLPWFLLLATQLPLPNPERLATILHLNESFVLGFDGECALFGYPSPSKLPLVNNIFLDNCGSFLTNKNQCSGLAFRKSAAKLQ